MRLNWSNRAYLNGQKLCSAWRTWWWRHLFGALGPGSVVYGRLTVYSPFNIRVGRGCTINDGCVLNARDTIAIGDGVRISPGCILNTGSLDLSRSEGRRPHASAAIVIEDNVWLASGVIVNAGVRIGYGSVVGAGAVVTRDVPPNVLAVGVPARVMRALSEGDRTDGAAAGGGSDGE
jgi:maltose O-acetyltransferase